MCTGAPARLIERRKPGSTHSSTSGRQISASDQQRERADRGYQHQGCGIEAEHVAEQKVQQVDVGAARRHDGDAERERHQKERGERSVFLEFGDPRDDAGEQRHQQAGDQAADASWQRD